MLVCSLGAGTTASTLAGMREARAAGADLVELRLDLIEAPDLPALLAAKPLPVIATCRPAWEGGRWSGPESDRVGMLEDACVHGADYVDIEFKAFKDFKLRDAKLIVSWHDFEAVPPDPAALLRKLAALEPVVVKLGVTPRSAADLLRALEAQKGATSPSAVVAMGDYGRPLRGLYRRYGGFLTYASLRRGEETAPGQPTVEELVKGLRCGSIDDETKVYAVLGDPVEQSRSPGVFNRLFQELGLNARYVALRVDDPAKVADVVRGWELAGASVTAPLKEAARAQVDAADEVAAAVGAVNTIAVEAGKLEGANTDVAAAVDGIKEAAQRKWHHGIYGLRALVIGAGGAARAVAWGLRAEGARVILASRGFDRARTLAGELGAEALPMERIAEARAQIVCNATPVGSDGTSTPYPAELWKRDAVAFDAVHTPRRTRFLREAGEAGAETADGVGMFLRQADAQAKRWLGRGIPTELMKDFRKTME